jgi:hypothetical protein
MLATALSPHFHPTLVYVITYEVSAVLFLLPLQTPLMLMHKQALVSLGEVRRKLTGLQWSYAKLSGPSSVNLLASCTNLRSLKLRLWYQDYNLAPFDFNLLDLSQLAQLRTLVIDKRPPFQQQLPAQQSAISMPITTGMLSKLARCWPHLEKLQLGLARSDFEHNSPLEGLSGFSQLRSLSVHCYDQGYDDGHFMLPINVAALPSSLVKLDLMHAELFSSNGSSSQGLMRQSGSGRGNNAAGYSGSSYLMSSSSSSFGGLKSYSSIGDGRGSRSVSAGGACGCSSSYGGAVAGRPMARSDGGSSRGMPFTSAAGGFTSMLSESFSLLSRQASAECSAAYLSTLMAQREEQLGGSNHSSSSSSQGAGGAGSAAAGSSSSSTGSTDKSSHSSAGAGTSSSSSAAAASSSGLLPSFSLARGSSGLTEHIHSGWLQELLNDSSSSRGAARPDAPGSSSSSVLPRQPSLPPLPRQQSLCAPGHIPPPKRSNSAAAQQSLGCTGLARQAGKNALLPTAERQIGSAAATAAAGASIGVATPAAACAQLQQQQQQQQPATGARRCLQNPFAAAAAAAAVHAEMGGCVAAVEQHSTEADSAAAANAQPAAQASRGLTSSSSAFAKVQENLSSSASASSSSGSGLGMSFSLGFARSFSKGSSSKAAAAAAEVAAVAAWEAAYDNNSCGREWEVPPGLPLLQHLQLKHCALDGIGLEDVITAPAVSVLWLWCCYCACYCRVHAVYVCMQVAAAKA